MIAPHPTIASIQHAVAQHYGITRADIVGDDVARSVSRPRQIAMYLAHSLTLRPNTVIAREFRRTHWTVRHGVKQVRAQLSRPEFRAELAAIREVLR